MPTGKTLCLSTKRIFGNEVKSSSLLVLLFFTFCLVITFLPLMTNEILQGHDIKFHTLRIEAIKDAILKEGLFVKVMPLYFDGYGYANGLFYPDLFLFIPALFRILGLSPEITFKLFLMLISSASVFTMYFCAKRITDDHFLSICATLLYTFANYRIANLMIRMSIGECLAQIFLPLLLLGIYEILFKDSKKWYFFTLGLTGIVLSHVLSVIFAFILCAVFLLISCKRLIKEPVRIAHLFSAVGLSLLLTAYFWLPMLEQMIDSQFAYQRADAPHRELYASGIPMDKLFSRTEAGEKYFIGLPLLVPLLLFPFLKKKDWKNTFFTTSLIGGLAFFLLTFRAPWWRIADKYIQQLTIIQFPWRFAALATLLLCLCVAYAIKTLFPGKTQRRVALILLFLLSLSTYFLDTIPWIAQRPTGNITSTEYGYAGNPYAIGSGEYLPLGLTKQDMKDRGKVVTSDTFDFRYSNLTQYGTRVTFDFETRASDVEMVLPLVYYKGYTYTIYGDGRSKQGDAHNAGHFAGLNSDGVKKGTVTVKYTGTTLTHISYGVTLLTGTAIIALYILRILRQKRRTA